MNRREFVRVSCIAATSTGLAGCAGIGFDGDDGDDADAIEDHDGADVSTMIVRQAPENQAPYEDSVDPVTPEESNVLVFDGLTFQRAGPRGLVVAGDLTNSSGYQFAVVDVQVVLYEGREAENVPDSTSEQTSHGRLEDGETWQWVATFDEQPEFEIDYYSIEAVANYD